MDLIEQLLNIPKLYIRPTPLRDVFVAAVHQQWCLHIKTNSKLPSDFKKHNGFSVHEVQALLWDSETLLGPDWMLVYIHVIPKVSSLVLSGSSVNAEVGLDLKDLTYSQFLHYVSQTNFKNLWKEAQKKYPEGYRPFNLTKGRRGNQRTVEASETQRTLLTRAFNIPVISLENNTVVQGTGHQLNHALQAVGVFEGPSHFFAITEHVPHSIHQCLSLSPALLSTSSSRSLYLLFQMLHAIKEIQDRSLFIEGVSWHQVFLTEDLMLKLLPNITSSLILVEPCNNQKREANLQELTMSWVQGSLSNYDYLMALNDLAGRQMDNPFNHPVLPWVSDLSSPFGNWRDLTKSKFRLNKGDRQLDLTFDPTTFEVPEGKDDASHSQVPHHVTDVLSEITYYVYKARQTARLVLCRYVRPNWNPLEYPSSIERMQQWTPDECIPQFFSDPSIFKSIHDDLPDLSYPSWANSAEDFITKHRNALESPYVSERLHHWIDLTFGFRLSGSAAVKAKNVHLSLVDGHVHLTRRGVVQLFTQPHPRRLLPSPYVGRSPPRLPPAEDHLSLPLDYNPTGLLRQLESVSTFYGSNTQDSAAPAGNNAVAARRQRDLEWLVTLSLELFLPQRFRLLRMDATLEERLQVCKDVYQFDKQSIPRCLRAFVKTVFNNEAITDQGLPPPSAHQLLQPMVSLIPFPDDFPAVLRISRNFRRLLDTGAGDFASLGKSLSALTNPSSAGLLLPFVKMLLNKHSTAGQAALYLIDPVASVLGPVEAAKEFMSIVVRVMAPDQPSPFLIYLYHKRFLLMLQIRFGLKCFLQNIPLLLVEAVGGCYDFEAAQQNESILSASNSSFSFDKLKLDASAVENEADHAEGGDVFTFEVGEEACAMELPSADDPGGLSGTASRNNSSKYSLAASAYLVRDINQLDGCNVSQVSLDSLLWQAHRLGPVLAARHLTRNLLKMLAICYVDETSLNLAESSKESGSLLMSGALLQGDFNANRVLSCLTSIAEIYGEQLVLLQYYPHVAEVVGRCNSPGTISLLLEGGLIGSCSLILASIPCLQDTSFMLFLREVILRQLIEPMVNALISTRHVFARGGSARAALAVKLLDCICGVAIRLGPDAAGQFLTDIIAKLFQPFERVTNGTSTVNQSAPVTRPDYMCHQRRLSSTLRQAEADNEAATKTTVSRSSVNEAQALAEIALTFTDHYAFQLLSAFNLIVGVPQVQALLQKSGHHVQKCATRYVSTNKSITDDTDGTIQRRASVFSGLRINRSFSADPEAAGSYGSRVSVVGNRIQLFAEEEAIAENPAPLDSRPTLEEAQEMLAYKRTDSARHLRGNWLAYWEHEAGRADRDTRFNFKQIRLIQLNGHTAGVRSIHVMDSETGVLTAGRDKTARVWSLHSQGDGSGSVPSSYVYQQHRKPLLGVCFIDAARLTASCDGAVHLWDPFVGTSVRQLDGQAKYPTVTAIKPLPGQPVLAVATAEGTVRLLDTRSPLAYQHDLKLTSAPAGLVRCLSAGPNGHWIAAGHSSGVLSLLDIRTGLLLSSWKGHEGEVLQVGAWTSPNGSQHLISSSLDQSLTVWSADDGKMKFNLRGTSEPVHCLGLTAGGELVTATTANRVGVHTPISNSASFSSTKLRSDTFKGVLTAMSVVPLNRMLLLGSDTGSVSLLC